MTYEWHCTACLFRARRKALYNILLCNLRRFLSPWYLLTVAESGSLTRDAFLGQTRVPVVLISVVLWWDIYTSLRIRFESLQNFPRRFTAVLGDDFRNEIGRNIGKQESELVEVQNGGLAGSRVCPFKSGS